MKSILTYTLLAMRRCLCTGGQNFVVSIFESLQHGCRHVGQTAAYLENFALLALHQIHLLFQQIWSHFELCFVSMNMFLDETSTLDTSYTASGLQFVIRLYTPNEYVHTGQAHANVCKLQIKRGITRCRLTPTFVFKEKFENMYFAHLFLYYDLLDFNRLT